MRKASKVNNASKRFLVRNAAFWITALIVFVINIFVTIGITNIAEELPGLHPAHLFARDFDFTDVYYKLHKNFDSSGDIVIINSFGKSAGQIASIADSINQLKPRVIGIDYIFDENIKSPEGLFGKEKLSELFAKGENVVLGFLLNELKDTVFNDSLIPGTKLSSGKCAYGFLNLSDSFSTIRRVILCNYFHYQKRMLYSFDLAIAIKYFNGADPRTDRFVAGHDSELIVKYIPSGNFRTYNADSVLQNPGLYKDSLENKIVLIGECGTSDRHFTPINRALGGKSYPDMDGVYVHANVIHSILNSGHIQRMSDGKLFAFYLVAFILLLPSFLYFFAKREFIFHLIVIVLYEHGVYLLHLFASLVFYHYDIYIESGQSYFVFFSTLAFSTYLVAFLDWLICERLHLNTNSYFAQIRSKHDLIHKKRAQ